MKFNCKQVTIEDVEFGCTVTFYEKKDQYEDGVSIDKIIASQGQYILLKGLMAKMILKMIIITLK